MDSTDDDEEEDEDVLPFSLNRSFKPSFPDEEGITLEDVEAVVGTIPWAEKENPCERPLPKRTAGRDGGKGRRSKAPGEGDFVDDVAPKPRTVKAKISDESEDAIKPASEEKKEDCAHSFITTWDLGRWCTICGLVVEHIKDMVFMWHKPVSKRKRLTPGERQPSHWSKEGDDAELEEPLGIPGLEVHPSLEEALHPHQLDGFKFLSRHLVKEDAGGCMLAFAPGTGKTFLVISFLQSFLAQVPHAKPVKWEVEEIPIFDLYEANGVESQSDLLQKWQQRERSVLLVGYPQFVNMTGDVGKLLTEGPGLLILDEGHLARTKNTKILTSLMQVRTKRRVLLSGTPFNNNSDEFYHTLELIRSNFMLQTGASPSPTINSTEVVASEMVAASQSTSVMKSSNGRQAFKDVFGDGINSGDPKRMTEALRHLRTFIAPFVSWHKGEILDTLPGISDFTVMLHITPMQRRLLDLSEMKNNDNLQKRAAAIYVHPVLEPVAETGGRSRDDLGPQGDVKVTDGAKLRWVLDLVRLCHAAGERLLIFSEYLYALALVENMTSRRMGWSKGVQILRLDGKMHPAERESTITRFNSDSESRVLCASVKACGEGISLVGASRVVLLEVSWNSAVARQAISRAFRIGQQRKVVLYRLIAADTHEEHKIHESSVRKDWLARVLFDQNAACNDYRSILCDVTKGCSDRFLDRGPLRDGVRSIYEREF
ncbi:unnamed protein product [Sphagnum troendelagicum]